MRFKTIASAREEVSAACEARRAAFARPIEGTAVRVSYERPFCLLATRR